jgi:hypothetical protein
VKGTARRLQNRSKRKLYGPTTGYTLSEDPPPAPARKKTLSPIHRAKPKPVISLFDEEKRAKFEAEVAYRVKQIVFQEFCGMINRSNGIDTYAPMSTYKFYIG